MSEYFCAYIAFDGSNNKKYGSYILLLNHCEVKKSLCKVKEMVASFDYRLNIDDRIVITALNKI